MGGVTIQKKTKQVSKQPMIKKVGQMKKKLVETEDVDMHSSGDDEEDVMEEDHNSSSSSSSEEEEDDTMSSSSDSDSDAGHQMGRKAMFKRQLQTGKEKKATDLKQKKMASKQQQQQKEKETTKGEVFKNRQRVLVVASRGVTER